MAAIIKKKRLFVIAHIVIGIVNVNLLAFPLLNKIMKAKKYNKSSNPSNNIGPS